MTSTVVTISPETTVRETMEALATNHLSGVPVVVRDKVVGVVSMTDILNFMVTAPQRKSGEIEKPVDQTTAADLMTDEIFSVRSTSSIRSAAALMQKRGIHRVLVIDDGKLLGIVSALDIARVVSEKGLPGKTGVKRDPCADKPSPWITL
ncbi:MAG TPA: CBS domain-containing protein [Gemmatimonadaceae bacterium]|nr:CBS domain-containing protein [Gemmatimonadaceae bacterium]